MIGQVRAVPDHLQLPPMSAALDVLDPDDPKRVLMVVANASTSPVTGWPVGFWWAELTHPYWVFTEHGYEVDIASSDGGALVADSWSDPEDESGYSAHDLISLGFKHSPSHAALVADTPALDTVDLDAYDALFFVGGQSPMVTFAGNEALQAFLARAYEAGKVVAVVCHATCLLLETTLSDGSLLVNGKTWTGFADSESSSRMTSWASASSRSGSKRRLASSREPTSSCKGASRHTPSAMGASSPASSSTPVRRRLRRWWKRSASDVAPLHRHHWHGLGRQCAGAGIWQPRPQADARRSRRGCSVSSRPR